MHTSMLLAGLAGVPATLGGSQCTSTATEPPGRIGARVTGSAVAFVAPVTSKFSRYSPAFDPLLDSVPKPGAAFSYVESRALPAARECAAPCARTVWAPAPKTANAPIAKKREAIT